MADTVNGAHTATPARTTCRRRGPKLIEHSQRCHYFQLVNSVDVLILHGSPGSGKTTLSRAIAEHLRTADMAHAVIDLDDLCKVYPTPDRSFARENLNAIWPN